MKNVKPVLAALGAFAVLSLLPPAAGAQESEPDSVVIKNVVVGGNGCPDGSAAAILSPDSRALTLVFSDLDAKVGPDIDPGESHEFCKVKLMLDYPAGWRYALVSADYIGMAIVGEGLVAEQRSTYRFHGDPHNERSFATTVAGPQLDAYFRHDEVLEDGALWSACGKRPALTIDVEVDVSRSRDPVATGFMNVAIADISATHTYGLAWQRCSR